MKHATLLVGSVMHRRLVPRQHRFRYACFWFLIDLDVLETGGGRPLLFRHNATSLFSLRDRDHGDGSSRPLKSQIEERLLRAGLEFPSRVEMMFIPRTLGYSFNPLTLYFCYRDQQLFALVYEVHNTFGERHFYVLPNKNGRGPVHQSCKKAFFVSPFLDMDLAYSFSLVHSERHVSLSIRATRNQTPVLLACLAASKRTFSDANLLRAALRIPLAPFKVIAAIHFEALRLWLKGVPGR